jgi:hypothetical protein
MYGYSTGTQVAILFVVGFLFLVWLGKHDHSQPPRSREVGTNPSTAFSLWIDTRSRPLQHYACATKGVDKAL